MIDTHETIIEDAAAGGVDVESADVTDTVPIADEAETVGIAAGSDDTQVTVPDSKDTAAVSDDEAEALKAAGGEEEEEEAEATTAEGQPAGFVPTGWEAVEPSNLYNGMLIAATVIIVVGGAVLFCQMLRLDPGGDPFTKTVADVGLVGYPNAGKSTLLAAISPAKPKIASYPFTTLHPIIGTIEFEDYGRMKIADIPGLIDGAHKGVGLGHDFLRHIERTKFLLFVIDMAGVDGRTPTEDFRNLRKELKLYSPELARRPYMIVANKMDLAASTENVKEFKRRVRIKPFEMSAAEGMGIDELRLLLRENIKGSRDEEGSP